MSATNFLFTCNKVVQIIELTMNVANKTNFLVLDPD